jgi:hypothetical protein
VRHPKGEERKRLRQSSALGAHFGSGQAQAETRNEKRFLMFGTAEEYKRRQKVKTQAKKRQEILKRAKKKRAAALRRRKKLLAGRKRQLMKARRKQMLRKRKLMQAKLKKQQAIKRAAAKRQAQAQKLIQKQFNLQTEQEPVEMVEDAEGIEATTEYDTLEPYVLTESGMGDEIEDDLDLDDLDLDDLDAELDDLETLDGFGGFGAFGVAGERKLARLMARLEKIEEKLEGTTRSGKVRRLERKIKRLKKRIAKLQGRVEKRQARKAQRRGGGMLNITDPAEDFISTPDGMPDVAMLPAETGGAGGVPTPLLVAAGLAVVGGIAYFALSGGEESA